MRHFALVAAAALCLACDPGNEVHLEPGSTAERLMLHAFQVPDSEAGLGPLSRVTVGRCGGRWLGDTMWVTERVNGGWFRPREATRFRYGAPPSEDWVVTRPASPLDSGCFYIDAEGGGIGGFTRIWIGQDGHVEPILDPAWRAREQP